jgi:hypothetical protein
MILSFVIFVTFLVFLYSALEPAIKTQKEKDSLLDFLEVEIINNMTRDLTVSIVNFTLIPPASMKVEFPPIAGVDGKRVLDVSGSFFNGKEMTEKKAAIEIIRCDREDATFNFVGENSVKIAKELGLVDNKAIVTIENIPFAMVLL